MLRVVIEKGVNLEYINHLKVIALDKQNVDCRKGFSEKPPSIAFYNIENLPYPIFKLPTLHHLVYPTLAILY